MSVETWGLLWGVISLAFIAGGLVVARCGLGRSPLRVVIVGNLVNWTVCSVFTLRSSIVLLTIGMVVWLALIPVIEAAEQTVLQRSIPFERQGRVFGFAQLVENAAAPLTALPHGAARRGGLHAVHDRRARRRLDRRLVRHRPRAGHRASMFTLAGLIGVVVTVLARASRSYRVLATQEVSAAPA